MERDAISKVAREITTSKIEFGARFNRWGGGILVYGVSTGDLEAKRYVWVSLKPTNMLRPDEKQDDDVFALSEDAGQLTPGIPLLSSAAPDVREKTGELLSVPWKDLVGYLRSESGPPAGL
jgi:hypothetical protein